MTSANPKARTLELPRISLLHLGEGLAEPRKIAFGDADSGVAHAEMQARADALGPQGDPARLSA